MSVKNVKLPQIHEALVIGGFSLIVYFIIKLTSTVQADESTSWFIYYFSFIINFPHFLVSYQLLYWDARERLFSNYRYIVATIISPGILLGVLAYGLTKPNTVLLGHVLNAMYFFVGWHYIKQTFGVISVCNAHEKIFFNKSERFAIKGFLYGIWAMSWISLNTSGSQYSMEGISYTSFNLPKYWLQASYYYLIVITGLCLLTGYQKYIREGRAISLSGFVSIIALVLWYLPVLYNPTFFLIVPLFHSLQYLYFVYLVKTHEANILVPDRSTVEARKEFFKKYYAYLVWPFITGAIFMWFLPQYLDKSGLLGQNFASASPFMFAFTIFINIHHYFIDHAIWRADNPKMKKFLF